MEHFKLNSLIIKSVVFALGLLGFYTTQSNANDEHAVFCFRDQKTMSEAFENPGNRIAFTNYSGPLHLGLCWWHSRLQRAAFYLTRFAPNKPKPTATQVKTILKNLVQFHKVVEISGYANFYDFTKDFSQQVQDTLNAWQIVDGILDFGWTKGLGGESSLTQDQMKIRMDNLFQDYLKTASKNRLLWVLAQMPGASAHALLVVSMTPVNDGYTLRVIDSNFEGTRTLAYHPGDKAIYDEIDNMPTFVPYLGYENDNLKIDLALKKECAVEYTSRFLKPFFDIGSAH